MRVPSLCLLAVGLLSFLGSRAEASCNVPSRACICRDSPVVGVARITAIDSTGSTATLDQLYGTGAYGDSVTEVHVDSSSYVIGQRVMLFIYETPSGDGGVELDLTQSISPYPISKQGEVVCEYAETPVAMTVKEAFKLALDPKCGELLGPRLGKVECNDTPIGCSGTPGSTELSLLALLVLLAPRVRRVSALV